jgi:hypothetical protein
MAALMSSGVSTDISGITMNTAVPSGGKGINARVILWTDGAPNQYKCRQNFYWVANAANKFGITIVHRFGATAQFKGVHDKIGQVAKWAVK